MSAIWAKFNKNERNVSFGAAIVLIAWVVGLVGYGGFGVEFLGALGAAAVLVIYYLKYAPNQNIQWPVPIPTIVLIISAIIGDRGDPRPDPDPRDPQLRRLPAGSTSSPCSR